MDISGPVAILLFFLLLLVDMFFYGFDAAIDNLNEKEILHKAEEEKAVSYYTSPSPRDRG